MTQTDLIYRAFDGLKKTFAEDRHLLAFAEAIANADEGDSLCVTHNVCHVDEEWVAAIERGMDFIGKAIGEDRQFIRSNGEVKPIEKVRNVSRESVVHLSRHSDLISRDPGDEDVVPDKLYTVERLSDYAVYENRFLYALLTRIRDFVGYRYDSILRAYKTYSGELVSKKDVSVKGRKLSFELRLSDRRTDALDAASDSECAEYLARMEKIRQGVAHFLKTPLMTEVSKADKIKSKLTKTNVLRMDKNFKEAVSLYEYLLAYTGDGFTVERVETRLDPVPKAIAEELALAPVLSAFLAFEHGLGIERELRAEFEREEARREAKRQAELAERIKALRKRVEETGESMEEYMLLLEERNAALEIDSRLLLEAQAEIEEMNHTIASLRRREEKLVLELGEMGVEIESLKQEMEEAENRHREKVEEMIRERAEAENELKKEHAEALARAEEKKREALALAEEKRLDDVARAEAKGQAEIARIREESERKIAESRTRLEEGETRRRGAEASLQEVQKELALAERERNVLMARLTAVRKQCGLLSAGDDFTTEEGFKELEREFETLGRLVRSEWTDVKKMLKKEFSAGLRAVVKGKKGAPQKTEEYRKLSEETRARRERDGQSVGSDAEKRDKEPKNEEPLGSEGKKEDT